MKGLIAGVSLGLVLLFLLASCATGEKGAKAKGALESVPDDATLLVSVRLQKALADRDVQETFARIATAAEAEFSSLDEALTKAEEKTGVNLKDVEEVLGFYSGDIFAQGFDGEGVLGAALFTGRYDKAKIIATLEKEEGQSLKRTTYKGQELLSAEDEDNVLAFLGEGLFVFGTLKGVQAVIDVRQGDRAALSGSQLDSFKTLGEPWAKLALRVPAGSLGKLLQDPNRKDQLKNVPINLNLFSQVQSVGASLDKEAKDVALKVTAGFADAESAKKVSEGLEGLIGFLKAFVPIPGLSALLDKVQISASGGQVNIASRFNAGEVENLINTLKSRGQ